MIKKRNVKTLLQIKPTYLIEIKGEYYPIDHLTIDGENALVRVKGKEHIINENDLGNYTFTSIENYSDAIRTEVVYGCNHCSNPDFVFDSIESADRHIDKCLFNEANKKCVTCKHLKIREEAPYPRNEKKYVSLETYHAFGAFRTPICKLLDEVISEELLWDNHDNCYEEDLETDIEVERSDEYVKWVELSTSDDVAEFYEHTKDN